MNTPTISIIMPIFNGEKWLELAIESMLIQHNVTWELVIVNDSSTDKSCKLIQKYVQRDSRISLITNTHTKGLSGTRNTGLEHAKGKYVAFLDCDDMLLPNALYAMQNLLETTKAPVARGYSILFDELSYYGHTQPLTAEEHNQKRLRADITPSQGPAHMYVKSFLDEHKLRFDEDIHSGEDTYFLYKLYSLTEYIPTLTEPSYIYYINHKPINYAVSYMTSLNMSLVRILDFLSKNNISERAQPYADFFVIKWLHHMYIMQQQPADICEDFLQTSFDIFTNPHWHIMPEISSHFGDEGKRFYELCLQRNSAKIIQLLQKKQLLSPPPQYYGYAHNFSVLQKVCTLFPRRILNLMRNHLTRRCVLHRYSLHWKKFRSRWIYKNLSTQDSQ